MNSTRAQIRTEIDAMITAAEVDNFWTPDQKNEWINYAGRRVTSWANWKILRYALKTQSEANKEWYKPPYRCKNGSIFRITMDDSDGNEYEYDIKDWDIYTDYQDGETDYKVAAVLGDQFFLYPTPVDNNLEIGIYGYLKWEELTSDTDVSLLDQSFDESVVKLAFAQALKKEKRFGEANNEIQEVTAPEEGLLAKIEQGEQTTQPAGFSGRARSSRWSNY
jgi:hypothetical protein